MKHSPTTLESVRDQMRAEWNDRAREDAHYFVAFGRRDQDDDGFFETGAALAKELESELKRLPPAAPSTRRALEIGCGPGRLMRPLSRHFGEIHGIDVSDEMIARAKHNLREIPHAYPRAASGSDLSAFSDGYFDFVYSYAVFQHIPSAEVVLSYLRETARVLKPGGVARLQINGLPRTAKAYTTWEGVRIQADEVRALASELGVRLLSLTGVGTQYMWTTWQKPTEAQEPPDAVPEASGTTRPAASGGVTCASSSASTCRIRAISNAFSSEQAVPATGRLACAALSIEGLPDGCDLNSLHVRIDGAPGEVCYIGPRSQNGMTQVNVFLPAKLRTGLLPVTLEWQGRRLCGEHPVRVIPAGPAVPRLTALSDAVNLLSPQHIDSGLMKATIEEVDDIDTFRATVDGVPATEIETFQTDPLAERWEVNFGVPKGTRSGGHVLEIGLGRRLLVRTGILTCLALTSLFAADTPESLLRAALRAETGSVTLPKGTIELSREILLAPKAHDLDIRGDGTTIKAAATFRGRALLVVQSGSRNVNIHDLALDGNRDAVGRFTSLPPTGTLLSRVVANNGILVESSDSVHITRLKAAHVAGFTVLVSGGKGMSASEVEITESGGLSLQRRNNGSGGIALEDGTTDFDIRNNRFGGIRGVGVTLRGVDRGVVSDNDFVVIARAAIQSDSSAHLTVENNVIHRVGVPVAEADGPPVCIRFEHTNDSTVRGNNCAETLTGAMALGGSNNKVTGNHFTSLNISHDDAPGIWLAPDAKGNTVENNEITGSGMEAHCVGAAPGLAANANRVGKNECAGEASVARFFGNQRGPRISRALGAE